MRIRTFTAQCFGVLILCFVAAAPLAAANFIRGDANGDGHVTIVDPIYLLHYLFLGGQAPECMKSADGNDDGAVGISDPVFVLNFLFSSGDPIPAPYPNPGADPTPDSLPCGGPGTVSPPTCEITGFPAAAVEIGEEVTFTGVATDPEGDALLVRWHFEGAEIAAIVREVESGVPFENTAVFELGNQAFRVTLTATDAQDLRASDRISVIVGTPPQLVDVRDPVPERPAPGDPQDQDYVVLAFNDLGMHCEDLNSQPFGVLPPYNVLNAVVIERGDPPALRDDSDVELKYSAAANPNDVVIGDPDSEPPSINSTSVNDPVGSIAGEADIRKTDFWDLVDSASTVVMLLFGLDIAPDEGLPTVHNPGGVGRNMPGHDDPYVANDPQPFSMYRTDTHWFTAEGIPMTSTDDYGRYNPYPMLRVEAALKGTSTVVAAIDAVVPVSTEVDCRDCHLKGKVGADPAARTGIEFVESEYPGERVADEIAAKTNILRLHDHNNSAASLEEHAPVLCAGCHNSYALEEATGGGLAGDPKLDSMSRALHGHHGMLKVDAKTGALLRDVDGDPILSLTLDAGEARLIPVDPFDPKGTMEANCFTCHPGKLTQCYRGVMFAAGLQCSSCHRDMIALAGLLEGDFDGTGITRTRLPWRDEPRCESCHRGDALSPANGAQVLRLSYDAGDTAAVPLLATNRRFAENEGKLYRHSHGHGGVACEGCHGSPHAVWPNPDPAANDNVTPALLQGYTGPLLECNTCHTAGSFPDGTLGGPHGMHPVNDPQWIKGDGESWHGEFAHNEHGPDTCAPCHGVDHKGTRLSVTPIARELRDGEGRLRATVSAGQVVSCGLCHSIEKSFED